MPLVEFPNDGDKFFIEKTINSVGGIGSMIALTLGKYGVDVDFTGAVGEDEEAKKIRELFESYQVKTQYLETCYTEKTAVSYKIYNSKSNKFSSISELANKLFLTKYKYEFIPDVVIMDDKDHDANLAAINNYPNSFLVYIGEKFTKNSQVYCNKCKYVICTLDFASQATGVTEGLNKSKNIVNLFQKFIDLYNTNLIIKLDNFDILYCVDDEVRLIKNINKSITNKDYVYYSLLVYFMINNYDVENAIKLTNKVMLSSKSEIDLIMDIPDFKDVEATIKEFEKMNIQNTPSNVSNVNPQGQTQAVSQQPVASSGAQQPVVQNVQPSATTATQSQVVSSNVQQTSTTQTVTEGISNNQQVVTPAQSQVSLTNTQQQTTNVVNENIQNNQQTIQTIPNNNQSNNNNGVING